MSELFPDLGEQIPEMRAATLKRRLDDGEQLTLLDTRRQSDFREWQITHPNLDVRNVPFTAFLDENGEPASSVPDGVPTGPLVTCCAKGISSHYVAAFLTREGWEVTALADGMEGWATVLETRQIGSKEGCEILQCHRPSSGCLSYLLVSGSSAAVVDPLAAFLDEYEQLAREHDATVEYALDTHVHADHVSGVQTLAERSDTTPVMPAGASDRGLSFDATLLAAGETLELGETVIEATGLPGHTTEMLGYRVGNVLLAGDTLFLTGVARPDLEDRDRVREAAGTLWQTIQQLANEDVSLLIAPGHVAPGTTPRNDGTFTGTLGALSDQLRAFEESESDFFERILADLPPRPANFEQIIAVNLGQETISEEKAYQLELGPNNCAACD